MDSASASSSSVSTKISQDGKTCIETSGGYGTGSDDNFEALWVEFDYFLETPKYVQTTLRSRDRAEAVESLMHDTLSTQLLGCELDDAFVYGDNSEGDEHFATGMPRSKANVKISDTVGLNLISGVNTSPADVQVGTCEPRGIDNECRHMRAFVILNLKRADEDDDDVGATTSKMDETRMQLKEETKRIIEEACDRGDYNGKFVKDVFIAGVSFVKPIKKVTTLDHGYDQPLAGISVSEMKSRHKMDKAEAYGIILLVGVAAILAAVAFLVTKTCRDARRRGYTKRSQKKPGKKGGSKPGTAAWTDQIIEVESESDAEDLEVTLYLRSPRNASDPKKQGSTPTNNTSRSPVSSPDICRAELHVRSPQNMKAPKKPTIPFELYQKRPSTDKKKNEKEDEETEATASISQITRSISSFEQRLDHTKIDPIYEEEYEI